MFASKKYSHGGPMVPKIGVIVFFIFVIIFLLFLVLRIASEEKPVSDSSKKMSASKSMHESDKIDSEGNYMPFYGYTVICMVSDRTGVPQQWTEFLEKAPVLRAHMSPLPASSYHATLYDIFTQRKVPERYTPRSGSVPSVHWTRAHNTLGKDMEVAQSKCEEVKGKIYFVKKNLKWKRHIGNSVIIEGTLTNMEEVSATESNMKQIFHEIGKPVQVHHITLGYVYKEIDDHASQAMEEELKGLWPLIQDHILLERPNVYYFETMKEFLPVKELQ
ncbi:2H-phosphodiest domain-containing protein [Plakobranchus ocellatus]|uniref:2H-phosphodiest domain-containing protein n=1 Tax=Plakobranchus ocellatus TaxID=259542 RepID=A0AAV4B0Q1_9GAST|nr:2H-phosphodiest domain-containing protein [Plakobranchus ocellatus]